MNELPHAKPPGPDGNPPPYTPVADLTARCALAERELAAAKRRESKMFTKEQITPICEALQRVYAHLCIANGTSVNLDIVENRKICAVGIAQSTKLGL